MPNLPNLYLIHASDAPQHLGKLTDIGQSLQTESRIGSFTTLEATQNFTALSDQLQSDDLLMTLLTSELEPVRESIVGFQHKAKAQHPSLKIAEIIVDQVPFENDFITFPTDLKPIRSREDINTVWQEIAQNLRDMFPVAVPNWKKYLPYAAVVLGVVLLIWWLIPDPLPNNKDEKLANKTQELLYKVDFNSTINDVLAYEMGENERNTYAYESLPEATECTPNTVKYYWRYLKESSLQNQVMKYLDNNGLKEKITNDSYVVYLFIHNRLCRIEIIFYSSDPQFYKNFLASLGQDVQPNLTRYQTQVENYYYISYASKENGWDTTHIIISNFEGYTLCKSDWWNQ